MKRVYTFYFYSSSNDTFDSYYSRTDCLDNSQLTNVPLPKSLKKCFSKYITVKKIAVTMCSLINIVFILKIEHFKCKISEHAVDMKN